MGLFLKLIPNIMMAMQVVQLAMAGVNFVAEICPDAIDNLPLFNDTTQERSIGEIKAEFRNPPNPNETFLRNVPDSNATYITNVFSDEHKPSDIIKDMYEDFSKQADGSDALDYVKRGVDDRPFEDVMRENSEIMSIANQPQPTLKGPDPEVERRIRENVAESQRAREASNYGEKGLDYNKHDLSSKNFDRLMEERGIPEDEARGLKESHNRWSPHRNDDLPTDTFAKHADPGGEDLIAYSSSESTNDKASGKYLTKEIYTDNANAIHDLATPAGNSDYHGNDMLHADRVKAYGNLIGGTVAPQPDFTTDAMVNGSDSIERAGGGEQYVTNGGFKSKAVETTGESWQLTDTAGRRKSHNPAMDSESKGESQDDNKPEANNPSNKDYDKDAEAAKWDNYYGIG